MPPFFVVQSDLLRISKANEAGKLRAWPTTFTVHLSKRIGITDASHALVHKLQSLQTTDKLCNRLKYSCPSI